MSTITNLITNPSLEVNDTGWSSGGGSGPGRTTSPTPPVGSYCYVNDIGTYTGPTLANGTEYTFSVYIYFPNDVTSHLVRMTHNGVDYLEVTEGDIPFDTWTRMNVTFTATASTAMTVLISSGTNYTAVDAMMLTQGSTLYDYFDGDTVDTSQYVYDWTGAVQASSSTRLEVGDGGDEITIPVEPEIDLDQLIMLSEHPLDKIVQAGEFTVSHSGAIAVTAGSSANYPEVRITSTTATNNYGRAGFIRAVYSIDNGNSWEFIDSVKYFVPTVTSQVDGVTISTDPMEFNQLQIGIGCDGETIYVKVMGQYFTGNPTANFVTGTGITTWSGWTASAQTVMIKYWLFERE